VKNLINKKKQQQINCCFSAKKNNLLGVTDVLRDIGDNNLFER
jgi:hypothetical protein